MYKPDPIDDILKDELRAVVAMVRSGAKHECGVKLNQKQCQILETVLMRSVDIFPLMEALSKTLHETIIAWRNRQ